MSTPQKLREWPSTVPLNKQERDEIRAFADAWERDRQCIIHDTREGAMKPAGGPHISGQTNAARIEEDWRSLSVTAIAAENQSVMEYCAQMEKQIAALTREKAEGEFHPWKAALEGTITSMQAKIAALEAKLRERDADSNRIDQLAEMWRACPHAVVTWNDDPDNEDSMGALPLGYSIRVHSCAIVDVSAPTLREAIDLLKTEPDEDNNVLAAPPAQPAEGERP